MATTSTYKQCHLVKRVSPTETLEQTSWIPSRFAVVGKVLRLRDEGEGGQVWTDGWVVTNVGHELPDEAVIRQQRDWLRTRRASDRMRDG